MIILITSLERKERIQLFNSKQIPYEIFEGNLTSNIAVFYIKNIY